MKAFSKNRLAIFMLVLLFFVSLFFYRVVLSEKLAVLPLAPTSASLTTPISDNISFDDIGLPVRLKIPRIGVDAPGTIGSAVMAGHLDDKFGKKAVFYNLKKLKKGDKISVVDASGNIINFVVREKRSYKNNEYVPEIFVSKSGKHLNLITCSGRWIKSERRYSERLVIFSDAPSN